ncbi:MAG: DNA replication/repair protein RecF [Limnochordia bacterium]
MRVKRLLLSSYRNYDHLDLEVTAQLCIFVGANAQGKTNLLEALYYLATTRSFRATRDDELIKWGADEAVMACEVEREVGQSEIRVRLARGKAKLIAVNGQTLRRQLDLFGHLNVVTFSPDDLQLVKGGPSERRRFLDMELAQISPAYRHDMTTYQRILRQRNNLLKEIAEWRAQPDLLEAWDLQLADTGSRIMARRAAAVTHLASLAHTVHQEITQGSERLTIRYRPFFGQAGEVSNWQSLEMVRERFAGEIKRLRAVEMRRGQTLVGPQRDDLEFLINDKDVRSYGSQGQQRTCVLASKLAEIEFMHAQTDTYPVLLLDDVMSELDQSRRHYFLGTVSGRVQTFITTTGLQTFPEEFLSQAQVTRIAAGRLNPR